MTAGQVTLKPKDWPGFHGWEVWDGRNRLGLVGEYGDLSTVLDPYPNCGVAQHLRWYRAFGTRLVLGLGEKPVPAESGDVSTRDEAVAWLLDGAES